MKGAKWKFAWHPFQKKYDVKRKVISLHLNLFYLLQQVIPIRNYYIRDSVLQAQVGGKTMPSSMKSG